MGHLQLIRILDLISSVFYFFIGCFFVFLVLAGSYTFIGMADVPAEVSVFIVGFTLPLAIFHFLCSFLFFIAGIFITWRGKAVHWCKWFHIILSIFLLIGIPVAVVSTILVFILLLLVVAPVLICQGIYGFYVVYTLLFNTNVIKLYHFSKEGEITI